MEIVGFAAGMRCSRAHRCHRAVLPWVVVPSGSEGGRGRRWWRSSSSRDDHRVATRPERMNRPMPAYSMMNTMFRIPVVVALVALAVCGGGKGGDQTGQAAALAARLRPQTYGRGGLAAEATRTVEITMGDSLRFDPATLPVKHGEIVTFHVVNT